MRHRNSPERRWAWACLHRMAARVGPGAGLGSCISRKTGAEPRRGDHTLPPLKTVPTRRSDAMRIRWFESALVMVGALALVTVSAPARAESARTTQVAPQEKTYRSVPAGTVEFSPSVSYSHWNV